MSKKKLCIGVLFFACSLSAEMNDADRANTYFAAGDYIQAIEVYQKLLHTQNPGIKKGVLHFNLGTSYLAEKKFASAIEHLTFLTEPTDPYPDHLRQRAFYNLILSHLGYIDVNLDDLEENSLSKIAAAKASLEQAFTYYEAYSALKYPDSEEGELPDELIEIKNALKELKSKYKRKKEEVELQSLNFGVGLQTLIQHSDFTLHKLTDYMQQGVAKDLETYLLTKQYVFNKKLTPHWKRFEEVLQKEIELLEKEIKEGDKVSEKVTENLQAKKACSSLFQHTYSRCLTALDYLKEHRLKESRLEYAKMKIDLTLMDKMSNQQDGLLYCLQERVQKHERKEKVNEALQNSIAMEMEYCNLAALDILDVLQKRLSDLKESSHTKTESEHIQASFLVLKQLEERLKNKQKATLLELLEDCYLYQILKEKPTSSLLDLHQKMKESSNFGARTKMDYQARLSAFEIYLKVQKDISIESSKYEKIDFALHEIHEVQSLLTEGEKVKAQEALEVLLTNFDYDAFAAYLLKQMQLSYESILEAKEIKNSKLKPLEQASSKVLHLSEKHRDPAQIQVTSDYLAENLSKLEKTHELTKDETTEEKTKRLFIQSNIQSLVRMQQHLNQETLSSQEILTQGILEEGISLEFVKNHREHPFSELNLKNKMVELTRFSQEYPIGTVLNFEAMLNEEQQGQEGSIENKSSILNNFHAGLKEAEKALELLKQDQVNWSGVEYRQMQTLKYWKKALEEYNSSNSPNSNSSQNKTSSNDSSEQESSESKVEQNQDQKTQELQSENNSQDQDSELRSILQKLQEMEEDDQIHPEPPQEAKKGLRPW